MEGWKKRQELFPATVYRPPSKASSAFCLSLEAFLLNVETEPRFKHRKENNSLSFFFSPTISRRNFIYAATPFGSPPFHKHISNAMRKSDAKQRTSAVNLCCAFTRKKNIVKIISVQSASSNVVFQRTFDVSLSSSTALIGSKPNPQENAVLEAE